MRSRRGRTRTWAAAVVLLAVLPAAAADVELLTGNDLGAGNPFEDDRYTASFGISWTVADRPVTFVERMFTDREAARRFDETWLTVDGPLASAGRHAFTWTAGAVRVGRGLIGERGQNVVHEVVGSDEVALDYDGGSRIHPVVGAAWSRRVLRGGRLLTFARGEVATAIGFRSHAEWTLDTVFAAGRGVLVHASAGARWSDTEHDLLERHLETVTPVWEVGVSYRGRVRLAWSANRFGVEQRHLEVGFRLPLGFGR